MTEEEIETSTGISPSKEKRNNKIKESRKKRKSDLRRKNLGLGIGSIDVNAPTKSTKIKFDDHSSSDGNDDDHDDHDEYSDDERRIDENENLDEQVKQGKEVEDDDDSDDEVEQVSASTAKNEALQMRAAERETRKVENALSQKRKRKKKTVKDILSSSKNQSESDNDDELDEEFLSMVDTARENDSKMKKLKRESSGQLKKLGRHTTFVSEESESIVMKPIHSDHNIDVVVLPLATTNAEDDEQSSAVLKEKAELSLSSDLSTKPSNAALFLCRGTHNIDSNPGGRVKQSVVKRSKKMKYRMSLGRPAANFAGRRRKRG